jgi:opacity protein-like surface antigen
MKTVLVVLAVAVALARSLALADSPARTGASPRAGESREGYSYTFSDDPLDAGGLSASDARIRVRPGGVRGVLTRPRTSFVPEMIRAVETL